MNSNKTKAVLFEPRNEYVTCDKFLTIDLQVIEIVPTVCSPGTF